MNASRPLILAGFDGFIDTIARPVRKSGAAGSGASEHFATIAEFGAYISGQAGKSASIELEIVSRRMGGNMPNFVRGAAELGAEVYAVGMLSAEGGGLDPVFASLPARAFSYAPAGTATALEFDDGKIFLAPRYDLEGDPWPSIEAALDTPASEDCQTSSCQTSGSRTSGSQNGPSIFEEAGLIACLNWSELAIMDGIWQRLSEKCAASLPADKEKYILFDLCDVSRRDDAEIRSVLGLLSRFSPFRTVILSLNRNEALRVSEAAGLSPAASALPGEGGPLPPIAAALAKTFGLDEVLIHTHDGAFLHTAGRLCTAVSEPVLKPAVSTGAGDRFNAAYAFAALSGQTPEARLDFAVRYAREYIQTPS